MGVFLNKKQFKMLELSFSSKLNQGSYIASIAKTAFKKIRVLICSMKFLSSEVVIHLCKSTTLLSKMFQLFKMLSLFYFQYGFKFSHSAADLLCPRTGRAFNRSRTTETVILIYPGLSSSGYLTLFCNFSVIDGFERLQCQK